MPEQNSISYTASAQRTIRMEAAAVAALEERIGDDFSRACELLLQVFLTQKVAQKLLDLRFGNKVWMPIMVF